MSSTTRRIKVLNLVGDWVEDYEAMIPMQALEMLGIEVHTVSPGKDKGQLVLSCVHDFDRSNIDGATDFIFANALGISSRGHQMQFQAVSERVGHAILINKAFDEVDINDYDGIFCPGGRSPEALQINDTIVEWIRTHFDAGKPTAGICHGVQMLAAAGVLNGKKCTGHPFCRPQVVASGGIWEATDLVYTVEDGHLITVSEWTGISGFLASFARALGVQWTVGKSL